MSADDKKIKLLKNELKKATTKLYEAQIRLKNGKKMSYENFYFSKYNTPLYLKSDFYLDEKSQEKIKNLRAEFLEKKSLLNNRKERKANAN